MTCFRLRGAQRLLRPSQAALGITPLKHQRTLRDESQPRTHCQKHRQRQSYLALFSAPASRQSFFGIALRPILRAPAIITKARVALVLIR